MRLRGNGGVICLAAHHGESNPLLAAKAVRFHLLSFDLVIILVFIGTKMLRLEGVKIPGSCCRV
jgi:hypothetical protein